MGPHQHDCWMYFPLTIKFYEVILAAQKCVSVCTYRRRGLILSATQPLIAHLFFFLPLENPQLRNYHTIKICKPYQKM